MHRPPPLRPRIPPPPPPRGLRPRRSERASRQYLAIGVGVVALTLLMVVVVGIMTLGSPNPSSSAGRDPQPAPEQPAGAVPLVSDAPRGPEGAPSVTIPEPVAPQPSADSPPPAAHGAPGSVQDVIARVKPSVVLVLNAQAGGVSSGTGFVVSATQVATCHHVIRNATRLVVITADGRQIDARVESQAASSDLAILSCSGALPPPLALGDSDLVRDGDEIAVTGFPVAAKFLDLGYEPRASTTRGTISATRVRQGEDGQAISELQIDAAVNPGNSGGPVYSGRDGTVVGIASAKLAQEQGIGFAVSVNALRRLLMRLGGEPR